MFDLRYHVASLAAVFIALIIGILVGVGLSGSGVTKEADLKAARFQRDEYHARLDDAQKQLAQARKASEAFAAAYPALMKDRLLGKNIAVLYIGAVDGGIQRAVDKALADAGVPTPLRLRSIGVPINADKLNADAPGRDIEALGRDLGSEFVAGGQTPTWSALGVDLVAERSGSAKQPADGVVVIRTVKPQQGVTARFLRGLYAGLGSAGAPVVGVETAAANVSAVPVYRDAGLSSVDDVDLDTGRAALALLLAGAAPGQYGVKDSAQNILPAVA